jgi:hypothetical protein
MLKGLLELGLNIDFLTVETEGKESCSESLSFMKDVNVIPLWTTGQDSIDILHENGLKGRLLRWLADIYHLFFIFGHTHKYAKNVKIDSLTRTQYDYVISVSDPKTSHVALKSLLRQGLMSDKIIEYWGDPLYGDVSFRSVYPNKMIKSIEYGLLKTAHRIVYTSPFTLEKEKEYFPKLEDRMTFVPTANLSEYIYKPFSSAMITVGYYGDYYSQYRDIIPLYQSFETDIIKNKDIKLIIVGDSDIKLNDTNNIRVLERQNVEKQQSKTDILVCILNNHGTQIPGKLYYNAGTNLPVLVILDGEYKHEIKDYLDSFNRFICCDNSVSSISQTIDFILNSKPTYQPSPLLTPQHIASKIIE